MKTKVLIGFVDNGKAGGVDKYILSLLSVLDMEKYEVTLLTKQMDAEILNDLKTRGVSTFSLSSAKHPIKQFNEMKKLMREKKIDVAYFNVSTAILGMGVIAAKYAGVKKRIVHSHSSGCDSESKMKRMIMTFLHTILKRIYFCNATTFVACSEKAGQWMYTSKMIHSPNYHVVHNTVCFEKFQFDKEIRLKMRRELNLENKTLIVHVANFTYPKNHEFLINVFSSMLKENSNYKLILIGSGVNEQSIRNQVCELGLQSHVIFTGLVNNVRDYLQAADIFVLPSRFEGYPISAVEAQVNGLTCVLSDCITEEVQLTPNCYRLPLKEEQWKEFLLNVSIHPERKTEMINHQVDNVSLGERIIQLWREE